MTARLWCRAESTRTRCNISRGTAVVLLAAFAALAGALLILGKCTEDVVRHNGLDTTDPANLHWFTARASATSVDAARTLSSIGSPGALAVIAVSAGLVLWWHGQRLFVAAAPAVSLVLAALAVAIGRLAVHHRASVSLRLVAEGDASFPSERATQAGAVLLSLALVVSVFVLRRWIARALVTAAAGMLAATVGVAQLVLGVQWPSDVLAGVVLGLMVALGTTIAVVLVDACAPGDWPARRTDWAWRVVNLRRGGPVLRSG
jgi:membrane-associated phospholipid phosphatase